MNRILRFKDFINEKKTENLFEAKNINKLTKASELICSFVNKKLGTSYIIVPVEVIHNGVSGIMMYDDNGTSAIKVSEPQGKTIGIVGSLSYFQDHAAEVADIELSSETFPIVKLLSEFTLLISDRNYSANIRESLILEKLPELSPAVVKEIEGLLDQGISVNKIAETLGVKYYQIAKIKQEVPMQESPSPVIVKNTQTLADKVKYLNELVEDIYTIALAIADNRGKFKSLVISGRAGTGKSYGVEKAMDDAGLVQDKDYYTIKAGVSAIETYKKLWQFNGKVLIFDDADGIFADPEGRNLLKGALDSRPVRRISWLKKSNDVFEPLDMDEDDFNAMLDSGKVPNTFDYTGRIIFISNLAKNKLDPDGALRSRAVLIDVDPDDATLLERIKTMLPFLEPKEMNMEDKQEIFDFMKDSKNVSMRTFEKAANFKLAGLANWKRMAERYV